MSKMLRKSRVPRRKVGVNRGTPFPGPYMANSVFTKKFRYQAQATETKDSDYITMASLQNLMFVGTSTGTVGVGLFSAVRLRKVEVWADSSVNNTLTTIGLDWLSPDAPNTQVNATGNALKPAHFVAVPPKMSAASRWYAGQLLAQGTPTSVPATSPYAFALISTVAGAICEITLQFTLMDYDTLNNPHAVTISGSGVNGCIAYSSYLDNTSVSLGSGTKNWLIQGVGNQDSGYVSSW